jgi:hypothetical protein
MLDRSVEESDCSNELRPYAEDALIESVIAELGNNLGSYVRPFVELDTLDLPGPHCCNCVVRFPVDAIVTFDTPGGGRGPDGCELPLERVDGSKDGY